jgi:hypothetical protein
MVEETCFITYPLWVIAEILDKIKGGYKPRFRPTLENKFYFIYDLFFMHDCRDSGQDQGRIQALFQTDT